MRPAKKRYKELRSKHKLVENLFNDEEWKTFRADEIPESLSKKMQDHISNGIALINDKEEKQRTIKLKLIYTAKYLAAASVILLVSFGLWLLVTPVSETPIATASVRISVPAVQEWDEVSNTGTAIRKIQLPDSSTIKLYPHASVKFAKIFNKDSRSVYLTGKAFFAVRKDPKRPFSVYAGSLKTTALGTAFTINTTESGNRTSVKLHHGKIVVSNSDTPSEAPVYISKAGAGLIYDPAIKVASLIPARIKAKPVPEAYLSYEGNTIILKNIPLDRVIHILKETYHVTISAESSIISNTTYTGTIEPEKETAEQVLKVICVINNLVLEHSNTQEFIIKKHN